MNQFMKIAYEQAQQAMINNEVPVGAVVVCEGKVVAVAHNMTVEKCDVTAHAEIVAIRRAEEILGDWRLDKCELYVTLEPCMMCMGAIVNSRIRCVYFGAYDKDFGFALSNHYSMPVNVEAYGGICETECEKILKDFFKSRRN